MATNKIPLLKAALETSLIYCIALPEPKFVEIPFIELCDKFLKRLSFSHNKLIVDRNVASRIRLRIPFEYRENEKFEKIHRSLYSFNDEQSLHKSILGAFPGKFSRLEKLLNNTPTKQ